MKTASERFDERHAIDPRTGCDVWIGRTDPNGYGRFDVQRPGRRDHPELAHRWLYQHAHHLTDEEMPDEVCHSCDNPPCIDERHLFPGTHQDNMDDMKAKGRGRWPSIHGSQSPNAKITEDDVRAIRKSALLQRDIAEQYGVHPGTISRILLRKSWTHI